MCACIHTHSYPCICTIIHCHSKEKCTVIPSGSGFLQDSYKKKQLWSQIAEIKQQRQGLRGEITDPLSADVCSYWQSDHLKGHSPTLLQDRQTRAPNNRQRILRFPSSLAWIQWSLVKTCHARGRGGHNLVPGEPKLSSSVKNLSGCKTQRGRYSHAKPEEFTSCAFFTPQEEHRWANFVKPK